MNLFSYYCNKKNKNHHQITNRSATGQEFLFSCSLPSLGHPWLLGPSSSHRLMSDLTRLTVSFHFRFPRPANATLLRLQCLFISANNYSGQSDFCITS